MSIKEPFSTLKQTVVGKDKDSPCKHLHPSLRYFNKTNRRNSDHKHLGTTLTEVHMSPPAPKTYALTPLIQQSPISTKYNVDAQILASKQPPITFT